MAYSLNSDLTYLCEQQQKLTNILSAYRKYHDRSTVEMILDGADELKHLSDSEFEAGLAGMLERIGGTIYNMFFFFIQVFRNVWFDMTHLTADLFDEIEDKIKSIEDSSTGTAIYHDTSCQALRKEMAPKLEKALIDVNTYAADMLDNFNDKKKFQKAASDFQKAVKNLPGVSYYVEDGEWEIYYKNWLTEGYFRQIGWGDNLEEFCKIAHQKLEAARKIYTHPSTKRLNKAIDTCNDELARARREGTMSQHDAEVFLRIIRNSLYLLWTILGIYHWFNLSDPVDAMFNVRGFKDHIFSTKIKEARGLLSAAKKLTPGVVAPRFENG